MADGEEAGRATAEAASKSESDRPSERRYGPLLFFGVFPAAVALVVELATGTWASARSFELGVGTDPLPTPWHAALIAVVPLAVWLGCRAGLNRRRAPSKKTWFLLGAAVAIAFAYSLAMLPSLPFALLGFLILVGILPLSPYLSLICLLVLWSRLNRIAYVNGGSGGRPLGLGVATACALIAAFEVPELLTARDLDTAVHGDAAAARSARLRLRKFGDQGLLARTCDGDGRPRGLFAAYSRGADVTPEQARRTYFEVTGLAFDHAGFRAAGEGRWRRRFSGEVRPWSGRVSPTDDPFRSSPLPDLRIATSRLDGFVEASRAVAYFEWLVTLHNDDRWSAEATLTLGLPRGGAVSRVSLWVAGEEREAAFAGRADAEAAYASFVERRRDPILVTQVAPDAVRIRCFPVPSGADLKFRVGVTAPCDVGPDGAASVRPPVLIASNVSAIDATTAWIEVDGPAEITVVGLAPTRPGRGAVAWTGPLDPRSTGLVIKPSDAVAPGVVVEERDLRGEAPAVVRQRFETRETTPRRRVVFSIDASAAVADVRDAIADAVGVSTPDCEFALVRSTDDGDEVMRSPARATRDALADAGLRLRNLTYAGGRPDAAAVLRAFDLAAEVAGGAVVRIHGPQPVMTPAVEALAQRIEHRPTDPVIYDFVVGAATDVVAHRLSLSPAFKRMARAVPLSNALRETMDSFRVSARRLVPVRDRIPLATPESRADSKPSGHLVRLWALDEIARLTAGGDLLKRPRAAALGAQYRLVTQLTSAVALETAADERAAGLTPAADAPAGADSGVPQIPVGDTPEPEEWALLGTACVIALVVWLRRRSP